MGFIRDHDMTPTQTMRSHGPIIQNYHIFVLFDSPRIGSLMTPVYWQHGQFIAMAWDILRESLVTILDV